tara:strand:- start:10252 stop:11787 length:1536 start_codon:yes stop_codon:yes gene_type:complete
MKLIKKSQIFLFLNLISLTLFSCSSEQDIASLVLEEIDNPSLDEIGVVPKLDPVSTSLKAFPSAYGAGAYTSGGRGGKILNVTTTEDTGREGSLRWAIGQTGPRIIVFKVGGEFLLTLGRLKMGPLNDNLTVAGQTAPGDGVTISGDYLQMSNVNNVIFRFIRFRGIKNGTYQNDIITGIDCTNIIMDHCSGSWGKDEIWSFTSSRTVLGKITTGNVTIQRSIMAEMDPEHSTGSLFGTISEEYKENSGDFSFNNNYIYNISHRFPNTLGTGKFEIKNNVIYNWSYRLTSAYYGAEVNQQNNYYKIGPKTIANSISNEDGDIIGTLNRVGNEGTPPKIYAKGNLVMPGVITDPDIDNLVMWRYFTNSAGKSRNVTVPNSLKSETEPKMNGEEFPLLSAIDAYNNVLSDVGANKSLNATGTYIINSDEMDEIYLDAAINDKGTSSYRNSNEWVLPPLNNVNNSKPYKDTDMDGMPDTWEIAVGLNPELDDSAGDLDNDGYTNIEEFINLVDF